MRISDWSSDVCSSDLFRAARWSFALLAFAASMKAALGGLVLLAAWGLTAHWAIWANHTLLLLDPICLLLVPAWLMSARATWRPDRKSNRLNSSQYCASRLPSSA